MNLMSVFSCFCTLIFDYQHLANLACLPVYKCVCMCIGVFCVTVCVCVSLSLSLSVCVCVCVCVLSPGTWIQTQMAKPSPYKLVLKRCPSLLGGIHFIILNDNVIIKQQMTTFNAFCCLLSFLSQVDLSLGWPYLISL